MGWSRDKSPRLYREANGSIVVTFPAIQDWNGITALANVYDDPNPSLASTAISPTYLRNRLTRVEFSELDEKWKKEIRHYFDGKDGTFVPEKERGFWKVENFKDGKAVEKIDWEKREKENAEYDAMRGSGW